METDMQPMMMAKYIAEERVRDHSREPVQLERSHGLARLLQSLVRIFN